MACSNCADVTIPTGPAGSQGEYGGFSQNFAWSTATSSNPAATYIRFNNSTYSSVTAIYVDYQNYEGTAVNAFLATIGNGDKIRVFRESNSNTFAMFTVNGSPSADAGNTYYTIPVTYVTHNGTLTQADSVVLTVAPIGSVASVIGPNTLFYTTGLATTATIGADQQMQAYAIDTDTYLGTNGDSIEMEVWCSYATGAPAPAYLKASFGTSALVTICEFASNSRRGIAHFNVARNTSTAEDLWGEGISYASPGSGLITANDSSGSDTLTGSLNLKLYINQATASSVTIKYVRIISHQKI